MGEGICNLHRIAYEYRTENPKHYYRTMYRQFEWHFALFVFYHIWNQPQNSNCVFCICHSSEQQQQHKPHQQNI